jgi:hypothetical protein
MRVDVDPTGRDDESVRVDLPTPPYTSSADLGNAAVVDDDISCSWGLTGPVDHRAPSDH